MQSMQELQDTIKHPNINKVLCSNFLGYNIQKNNVIFNLEK